LNHLIGYLPAPDTRAAADDQRPRRRIHSRGRPGRRCDQRRPEHSSVNRRPADHPCGTCGAGSRRNDADLAITKRLPISGAALRMACRIERVAANPDDRWAYIACMADILLGILAIIAGGAMLFVGQLVLRLLIPVWG